MILGFQGSFGSFGNIAALHFIEDLQIEADVVPFQSFKIVTDALKNGTIEYGVLPVFNKIVGIIPDANEAIEAGGVKVVAKYKLPIVFCLCTKNTQLISEIESVYSQNHALNQCKDFFAKHPFIKRQDDIDTALAAERVAKSDEKIAAICSELACKLNGLHILLKDFQDEKENYTEFALLTADNL